MNKTIFSIAFVMIMVFLNCHASGQDNDSFLLGNTVSKLAYRIFQKGVI